MNYSTKDAAKRAGIGRATLMRWLAAGKVRASMNVPLSGGMELHRWTATDIRDLVRFKKENYRRKA